MTDWLDRLIMERSMRRPALSLGTMVKPYGEVAAIANGASLGERYYFLVDDGGCVSMMPADVIESMEESPRVTPQPDDLARRAAKVPA